MHTVASLLVLVALVVAPTLSPAQDTCDVTVALVDSAPGIAALGLDYSGAGGSFPGDSNLVGFGSSWGTTPLRCVALATFSELTLHDDNVDTLSAFVANIDGTIAAGPLFSCVFTLAAGFPCPDPSAFAVTNASFPSDPLPPPFPLPGPPAVTITVAPRTPVCGDGFQEGGEECDDGNTFADDCCTDACVVVAAGTACDDHDACTIGGECSAAATCVPAEEITCDDGVPCTWDHCDAAAGCVAEPKPNPQCNPWRSGSIDLRDEADGTKDTLRIALKLAGGVPGDPTQTTDYAVCIFDSSAGVPGLAQTLEIPAGPPWTASGASGNYKYVDPARAAGGVEQVRVLVKSPTKPGKFQLKAKGTNLTLRGPVDGTRYFTNDPGVVVQVENGGGSCWNGTFYAAHGTQKNVAARYQAKD